VEAADGVHNEAAALTIIHDLIPESAEGEAFDRFC
jgi:hypothetical protein